MSFVSHTPEGNYREPSGRQKAKTFPTKTEAKRFLARIDSSLSHGLYVDQHAGRLLFATHALENHTPRSSHNATTPNTHVLRLNVCADQGVPHRADSCTAHRQVMPRRPAISRPDALLCHMAK